MAVPVNYQYPQPVYHPQTIPTQPIDPNYYHVPGRTNESYYNSNSHSQNQGPIILNSQESQDFGHSKSID